MNPSCASCSSAASATPGASAAGRHRRRAHRDVEWEGARLRVLLGAREEVGVAGDEVLAHPETRAIGEALAADGVSLGPSLVVRVVAGRPPAELRSLLEQFGPRSLELTCEVVDHARRCLPLLFRQAKRRAQCVHQVAHRRLRRHAAPLTWMHLGESRRVGARFSRLCRPRALGGRLAGAVAAVAPRAERDCPGLRRRAMRTGLARRRAPHRPEIDRARGVDPGPTSSLPVNLVEMSRQFRLDGDLNLCDFAITSRARFWPLLPPQSWMGYFKPPRAFSTASGASTICARRRRAPPDSHTPARTRAPWRRRPSACATTTRRG